MRDEADEARDRIEHVAAVREADELLLDGSPVVLRPGLYEVAPRGERNVVDQLQARVERRLDRKEERQPDPESVREVHRDIRKGSTAKLGELGRSRQPRPGNQRSLIQARPVFARHLHAEFVRQGVGQQRAQAPVDRVREVAFDPVCRGAPRIDVEGPVHLLRPGVVVLERGLVPIADIQVQLGQQGSRAVGAADRPELVVEQARPARLQEILQHPQVFRAGDPAVRLLGLGAGLLVIGQKVEHPVARDGTAQGRANLIAVEIGPAATARGGKRGGDLVPLPEVVGRAVDLVGPRLGNHVDKAPRGAAELGSGALIDHHQLLDGVLIERESRPLAAALLPEERVVEVRAVDDEVVEDAPLAADIQFVAVRPLRDRRARGEQGHVHEIAAVAREPVDNVLPHPLRTGHIRGVKRRRQLADHRDGLGRHEPEVDRQVERFPDPQRDSLDALGAESGSRRRHGEVVCAGRQQRAHKGSGSGGLHPGQQIGLPVLRGDHGPAQRIARRVEDRAADDAGRRPRLGRKPRQAQMERSCCKQRREQPANDAEGGASRQAPASPGMQGEPGARKPLPETRGHRLQIGIIPDGIREHPVVRRPDGLPPQKSVRDLPFRSHAGPAYGHPWRRC